MNKFFEKRFAVFEVKKRQKLGDKQFLEKYIVNFEKNIKLLHILLPIVIIVNLLAAASWTFLYTLSRDVYDLVLAVAWWVIAILWGFNSFMHYTHRFKFWKAKVGQWKQELQALNADNRPA